MLQELILAAGHTEQHDWRRRWRERNLFDCLAWRDILGRDQQTVIGISWAVIGPFLTMLVFTVVFRRIAKLQAPGALAPCGLLSPWTAAHHSLSEITSVW
jgi:homopolymeric O-antigen transport system permease protein